jgi:taurine dioxygenase
MHCGGFAFTSRREPEWTPGNLVVCDNRRTLQAATSIEAAKPARVVWRTTGGGNPGPTHAGEAKGWLVA